jgi:hypothetical protein
MEKIKASEVLNRFAYWAVDKDGDVRIHSRMPSIVGDSWRMERFNPKLDSVYTIDTLTVPIVRWQNSLREIDFSEDFAQESQEQSTNKSIFQQGDTVHVLSYSNQGELGVSTQGVVYQALSASTILVKIEEGVLETHKEKNISFVPFSIHEAGFSQIRPKREIKVGDWGFFYDDNKWFVYGQLHKIGGKVGTYALYHHELGSEYNYFSHTPPQLAEGIPNPFDKC